MQPLKQSCTTSEAENADSSFAAGLVPACMSSREAHLSANSRPAASWVGVGTKLSPRLSSANLMAFHSLLHQCLLATTSLMFRLMSPPCMLTGD